jgi:hypothetical protein
MSSLVFTELLWHAKACRTNAGGARSYPARSRFGLCVSNQGVTMTLFDVPLIEDVPVSVAVTVCVPGVLKVTLL